MERKPNPRGPVSRCSHRSLIVIVLELVLVLDFCHWLPTEHPRECKPHKLALLGFQGRPDGYPPRTHGGEAMA
jgi:hypothetical protein